MVGKKVVRFLPAVLIFFIGAIATAVVFKKPVDALKEGFKDADIRVKNIILNESQVSEIEKESKVKIENRLVSFYIAFR